MTGNEVDVNSTFFLAFVGQKVCISIDVQHTINFETADGVNVETMPLYYEGILLDYDKQYYYLGRTPIEITQAIRKDTVIHIMVIEEKSIYEEMLNQMSPPEKNEDVN